MSAATAVATTNPLANKKQSIDAAQILAKLKTFWASRTGAQKVYFGIGLAVTLASAAFFSHMIATPDYKPLMSGMEPADAQALTTQLAAKKIPYVVSPDGTTVSVPSDQVDAARLDVASHDAPHSGRIGFEIFDKVSWGETEFDEKVNYQRALEGELERTIQSIDNVKSARVHLVMATDSVFVDRERPAKASVTLRLKRGSLTREESAAITRLVAGAVDDLKPTDVALIDADSNKSLSLGMEGMGESGGEAEQKMSQSIMSTLSKVVGADGVHATVNIEYNTSSSEENQIKYDPTSAVPLSMQKSEETASGDNPVGGVPGTSSNLPSQKAAATSSTSSGSGQSSKTENATYGINRTDRHTVQPAGNIRRVTAAVIVDDAVDRKQDKAGKWVESHHKRSPEEMKLITELVQAAIGYDSTRGDVVSVQNLGFTRPAEIDLAPTTFVEKTRKGLNDYSSIVRYGVLLAMFLLVYMLMIRPIQKRVLEVQTPSLPQPSQAGMALPDSAEALALRSMAVKKQLTDFVKKEPETSATAIRAWLQDSAS